MLTLPPQYSHKMPPVDVTVFGPLKAYYNAEVKIWLAKNPGIPITIYQLVEITRKTLPKAVTPSNIISGF